MLFFELELRVPGTAMCRGYQLSFCDVREAAEEP